MKNIFLVGMPSSGKSTLGKKLARRLGYRFVDLDKLIEKDQEKTIPEIFREHGEPYFRDVEKKILYDTKPNHWLVVATGGGAPCFFDNMEFIKANGVSVFLNIPPAELVERIGKHGKDDRPLLSGVAELEKELTARLHVRLPYYSQAEFTISGRTTVQQLVDLVSPCL
ncbi:shikimate kinase [Arundinibacter roseus]|uniref:Shikimate kinase n=1 Tax=Arundinibacter roseus TaxID=2070510 RepID=A0A4R4KDR3_9BACT|nr:shikimate kinase [Arundinibacter roseus]TDB64529.1 shikimate kinase [Arundinibacter roseus]